MAQVRICVLGAGVIGLGSALCVQEMVEQELGLKAEDYSLDVVAEQFTPNLSSDVAAGFLEPYVDNASKHDLSTLVNWSRSTFDYFSRLWLSSEAPEAGLQLINGYILTRPGLPDPQWKDLVLDFHAMTPGELKFFPGHSAGFAFTTFICEQSTYLPYLTKKLRKKGVKFIQKRVNEISELCRDYDLIINCTGAGACALMNDKNVTPIKGQVVRLFGFTILEQVKAPWVKIFVMDSSSTEQASYPEGYILPNLSYCVLGGTHEVNEWDLTPSSKATEKILRSCSTLIPGIEKSEIIDVRCGLRPGRFNVRMETEKVTDKTGRKSMVVHNYGHGGIGVTIHIGCCHQAAGLARSYLQQISIKSKL